MSEAATTATEPRHTRMVTMDREGRISIPRAGANTAAILRIGIGLIYLWGFLSQGFGIDYSNQADGETGYSWHIAVDTSQGWISSGFKVSPTEGYIGATDGPFAFIPQNLPVGVDDFGWMFAIAGLGFALTLGICSRIAGWGGAALNILIWGSSFPPSNNPFFDAEHFMFAFILLLLMWLQASNHWGLGRWWRARTPAFLH